MGAGSSVIVIGGGFYGCAVAELLAGLSAKTCLLEAESDLLTRSSYHNQARLHGGYHYPRSLATAYRSRLNMPRFAQDFDEAIVRNFTKIYAISRCNSKISARQFEMFCKLIDAPVKVADEDIARLFSPRLIEGVYVTDEFAFDAVTLRRLMARRLEQAHIDVKISSKVVALNIQRDGQYAVALADGRTFTADYVFNCTYAGMNSIEGFPRTHQRLKHEVTELALVALPPELSEISATVMDGAFFSFMPFTDRKLSTFSHVRYTPQFSWTENESDRDPYCTLEVLDSTTRIAFMLRDASRYMPILAEAEYRESLYEIKTVLTRNELDDGRPILFEWTAEHPRLVSILGSKIDNVYDALDALREHVREH